MGETKNKNGELSLVDIFRLLFRKMKWLILITLIGAFVGAGLGFIKTYDKKYYGTTIKFFVNPSGKTSEGETENQYSIYGTYGQSVMDTMITLLSSEPFAATMLETKDENGVHVYLPKQGDDETLNALIEQANTARNDLKAKLQTQKQAYTALSIATDSEKAAAQAAYDAATAVVEETLPTARQATEKVYEYWRGKPSYVEMLKKIDKCLTFSYITQADSDGTTLNEDLVLPFIYLKISVLNDVQFAQNLYDWATLSVPSFVENKMWEPSGYSSTSCSQITLYDGIKQTNAGETTSTTIKYGILCAAASFVVACIAFVVIDVSDSRIRELDQVSEDLKIPLLGVIPSILIPEKNKEKSDKSKTKKEGKTV